MSGVTITSPIGPLQTTPTPNGPAILTAPDYGIDSSGNPYFSAGNIPPDQLAVLIINANGTVSILGPVPAMDATGLEHARAERRAAATKPKARRQNRTRRSR